MARGNVTLGRCWGCSKAYCWAGSTPLYVVRCPHCHGPLRQTNSSLAAGFTWLEPDYLKTCRTGAKPTSRQIEQARQYLAVLGQYKAGGSIERWKALRREEAMLDAACPYEPQKRMALIYARSQAKKEAKS